MKLTGSDIHLLSVFDSVVRNDGFSAAQIELGISQPTISNHITALEERLGVKLCQRGRRGFMLTEKGRMVHEIGQALLDGLNTHSAHLAELRGNLVGQLKIAMVDAITTDPGCKLPEAIRSFTQAAPAVRIDLSISNPQDIMAGLLDGSYHIGFGSFDNLVSGLHLTDLYVEPHALYCADTHPFFARKDVDITDAEIEDTPWVHRGYWSQQRMKSYAASDEDRIVRQIESQLMMVLSGGYLGLLPEHLAASFEVDGRLRRMACETFNFGCPMQLIRRSGAVPKVIERFWQTLQACYP
ncbi:LysR family transcriptional regulator [Roseovarius pelagicus]|uniref:LysR family transcriptional regulator n=1 Tax=Roseovarius pelagicus TaxID=2980108 RepID=A0ABY6DCJ6_9RHOB|nr:LysR family transcriptional regulator [Roseovarius pelagicus]UXX83842.1 LysR family transcriptional regulator [Roseovarius pelagicus]